FRITKSTLFIQSLLLIPYSVLSWHISHNNLSYNFDITSTYVEDTGEFFILSQTAALPGQKGGDVNGQVKSALRVLELFELFAERQTPLRLGEIVQLTGHPQSSVAALLATLAQAGYLTHDRKARHYLPSAKLAQIGMWLQPPDLSDEPALMALIHELSRAIGETIAVGEQAGNYARYLHVIPPRNRPIM